MDVQTCLALAQNAVDVGNVKAACEFYEAALAVAPNNPEVLEAYAEIMLHFGGDVARAEQMLRHAITVCPDEGYVKYLNLGQLLNSEESVQCFTKAYSIASLMLHDCRSKRERRTINEVLAGISCAAAELYLTDLCFSDNAEAECERAVNRALQHNPKSVEAHQLQGSLRLSQCRPEEAAVSLRRAVELTHALSEEHQPTYESKVELGRLLMQVVPDDAFLFLLEVLQMGDNNPYVWFLLGECARLRGRFVDSARLLRKARVMLVVSDGDAEAIREVDTAIAALVEDMGGAEAASQVPDLDHPNPIELLAPEQEDEEEDDGDELEEPEWEPCDEGD